jgi:hypothetical protein
MTRRTSSPCSATSTRTRCRVVAVGRIAFCADCAGRQRESRDSVPANDSFGRFANGPALVIRDAGAIDIAGAAILRVNVRTTDDGDQNKQCDGASDAGWTRSLVVHEGMVPFYIYVYASLAQSSESGSTANQSLELATPWARPATSGVTGRPRWEHLNRMDVRDWRYARERSSPLVGVAEQIDRPTPIVLT